LPIIPFRRQLVAFLIAACSVLAGCASPSKPSPTPVDQFPDGPKITCPESPSPITSNGQPVSVSFGTPTVVGGAPPTTISCTRESGSPFPIGTTTVTCTALDSRQRSDACTVNVRVLPTPKIQLTRFVTFGDSITFGEDGSSLLAPASAGSVRPANRFPTSQTYPGVLQQMLAGRYTTQTIVVTNQGFGGERAGTAATLSRFTAAISGGAEAVLLMEGTNDIFERDSQMIPAALTNLRIMLRDAKNRGLRPYLATIPPMIPNTARGLAWSLVPDFNDQIRALAAAEGVTLVDVHAVLNTAPTQYIGFDGLHPSAEGYAKIADTFFTAVKNTLETQPTTTGAPMFTPFLVRPHR
jgi:lysophospholipase L1-like esterase